MDMRKKRTLLMVVVTLALVGSACLFSPESGTEPGESGYYSPVDSAYKVVANLQLAYQTKDIDAYLECLHEEFEFMLLETDWDDYTGNGEIDESWGRDIEESMTRNMFSSPDAENIELTLEGNTESIWYGDSTGVTLELVRSFELKVYYWDNDEIRGYRAVGNAIFRCKPDENGEYQIWQWEDQSQT